MQPTFNSNQRLRAIESFLILAIAPIAVMLLTSPASAQEKKASNSTATKGSLPALATKVAFPNLQFDRPVAFAYPDDDSKLFFVNEQHTATIWSFPDDRTTSDKKVFLKLPDPINRGNEEGLLGLAFHPKYKENKQFFVYYSANDKNHRHSVVSRFHASSSDPRAADPKSEERIWVSAEDPFENHNGGTIAFGPDGDLYLGIGDGGNANDSGNGHLSGGNAQSLSVVMGKMLRIDPNGNNSANGKYGIPATNPFVGSYSIHPAPGK